MKRFFILALVALIGFAMPAAAQQYQEVVYLKNGSVIKGVVIEQIPGQSVKVQTQDGSIFVYKMSEVDKIVKADLQQKKTKFVVTTTPKTPQQPKVRIDRNFPKNIFGVRAGLNVAKLSGDWIDAGSKIGFHAGANYQRLIINNIPLYFETGIYFSMKGCKDDSAVEGMEEYDIEAKMNPMYIQIPVLLNYKFHINNDWSISPFAGVYCAIGVAGKYKETMDGNVEGEADLFESIEGEEAFLKRVDVGVNLGVTASYKKFNLGLGYEIGVLDNYGLKNRCFTLTVGYNF